MLARLAQCDVRDNIVYVKGDHFGFALGSQNSLSSGSEGEGVPKVLHHRSVSMKIQAAI